MKRFRSEYRFSTFFSLRKRFLLNENLLTAENIFMVFSFRIEVLVCHLGLQELPVRGHDESIASNNRGNYVHILNLLC